MAATRLLFVMATSALLAASTALDLPVIPVRPFTVSNGTILRCPPVLNPFPIPPTCLLKDVSVLCSSCLDALTAQSRARPPPGPC